MKRTQVAPSFIQTPPPRPSFEFIQFVAGMALDESVVHLRVAKERASGFRMFAAARFFAVEWSWDETMQKVTITIPLDAETARAYKSAAPAEKHKIEALLSLWMRELATGEYASLAEVLDEVGRKAKARGLTAETLDSLLKGA